MTSCEERDNDLGADEIQEILKRLPAKYVIRCKVLSKTYYAMIKSPSFISKHLLHHHGSTSTTNNIIIVSGKRVAWYYNTLLSLFPSPSPVYVPPFNEITEVMCTQMASCNGLLCAIFWKGSWQTVLMWNPAIREYIILPHPSYGYRDCSLGFGYDAAFNDYKLVTIHGSHSRYQSELWSRKTGSWREIEIKYGNGMNVSMGIVGLFVGGSLYWLARATGLKACLLPFDLAGDSFQPLIELPNVDADFSQLIIIYFMGSLALAIRLPAANNSGRCIYEIWVMDEVNNNAWTKHFSLGPFSYEVEPTYVSINGKFLMRDGGSERCNYFLYDPHNKERRDLVPANPLFRPCRYTESLVPVNQPCNDS